MVIGWGTWIRTKIDRVRVGSSTVELSPKENRKTGSFSCCVEAGRDEPRRLSALRS